jgi:aryl-alcohol dehydrogenase-like predicted oxidoreductase
MEYVHLGRTGLKVSRFCLGTMNFGPQTTEADSFAIMDKALELGINFFDTADVYGWKRGEGVTEQILGRWFAQGGRRQRVVLATKVFGDMDLPSQPDGNFARGLSARKIVRCCENSQKRTQTDCIDLYQMHHVDRDCPWDEIWQAMETLVQQGKIIYVGSSNFAGWHIAQAQAAAGQRRFLGLVCEQSKYHLGCRTIELEVLPACRHYGVGVIAYSPLGAGLLAGILDDKTGVRRHKDAAQKALPEKRPQVERWEAFSRELGHAPADLALAWLLHQPGLTGPIIGPRTMEQLTGAMRALDIKLDKPTLERIDAIWPGPGGQAPEAYAW